MAMHVPEKYRHRHGPMGSTEANGNNGAFFVPHPGKVESLLPELAALIGSLKVDHA